MIIIDILMIQIHNLFDYKNFFQNQKTRQILCSHARPNRGQLADAASLFEAGGKPSTWSTPEQLAKQAA